ncbi:hypothetical protein ACFXKC_51710 [Streptomyces sp. NPDC059340]|uniref:hypothetical protein n=1 Tax=Streptomyces sp. NPDC059340 TaxID=3346806 RepID=UPI00368D8D07
MEIERRDPAPAGARTPWSRSWSATCRISCGSVIFHSSGPKKFRIDSHRHFGVAVTPDIMSAAGAKLLGVSRNTIYNYVPALKGGRQALAEATNTAELPRPAKPKD